MLNISSENQKLILTYTPGRSNDASWVLDKLDNEKPYIFQGVFSILKNHIIVNNDNDDDNENNESISIIIGVLEDEYWKIDSDIIGVSNSIRICTECKIVPEYFIHTTGISIFKEIHSICESDIWIGGKVELAIPIEVFEHLLKRFPNYDEIKYYRRSRVSSVLGEYFESSKDYERKYENYLIKKRLLNSATKLLKAKTSETVTYSEFNETEIAKYQVLYDDMVKMLENDSRYDEKQWQYKMLPIILLLYPKYVKVLSEVEIHDVYSGKTRRLDYLLVDSTGCIDIIEIKKPSIGELISIGKYRDNYVPRHGFSGSVMQVEKYLYYLQKWGRDGEKVLSEKYRDVLPPGMNISITNPIGIIIAGRDLSDHDLRQQDFEIVKRKYKSVMDVITYDDLLRRLQRIIEKFKL